MDIIRDYLPPPWVVWIITCTAVLLLTILAIHLLRQAKRGLTTLARRAAARETPGEDILTIVAATIATGVSGQGMWQFFEKVFPGLPWWLRAALFAFIEVAMITSAFRARRNMRENYSAGVDGAAVRALTCLSAVLSSLESASIPEFLFRLTAPLVAAWLWERGMAIERRRITGRTRINWRITPERLFVRLGLAEANDRTAGEVDAQRRLTRVALAADNAHQLRATGAPERKQTKAYLRMRRAFLAAATHTGLARDTATQKNLEREVAALRSMGQLLDIPADSAWTAPNPVPEGIAELVEETKQLTAATLNRRDEEAIAALESAMEYIRGLHAAMPAGWDRTPPDASGSDRTLPDASGQSRPPVDAGGQKLTEVDDPGRDQATGRDQADATAADHDRPDATSSHTPTGRDHDQPPTTTGRLVLFPTSKHYPVPDPRPADQDATTPTRPATVQDATTPNRWTQPTPGPDATDHAETTTNDSEQSGTLSDTGGRDQENATKQSKKDVLEHIVATIHTTGRPPTKNDLKEWSGWGGTWCLERIHEVTAKLADGWTLDDATGQWSRPDDTDATTNTPAATGRINGTPVAAS